MRNLLFLLFYLPAQFSFAQNNDPCGDAILFRDQGRYLESEKALRECLKKTPSWAAGWAMMGDNYNRPGDYKTALRHYKKSWRLDKEEFRTTYEIGEILEYKMNDPNSAAKWYRRSYEADTTYSFAALRVALTAGRKDPEIAGLWLTKAKQADPFRAENYAMLAIYYVEIFQPRVAMEEFSKLKPEDPLIDYAIAKIEAQIILGDASAAVSDTRDALEKKPDEERLWFLLFYAQVKNYPTMKWKYESLEKIQNPYMKYVAEGFIAQSDSDKSALKFAADSCLSLNPKSPWSWIVKGMNAEMENEKTEVWKYYSKAARLNFGDVIAWSEIMNAAKRTGDRENEAWVMKMIRKNFELKRRVYLDRED